MRGVCTFGWKAEQMAIADSRPADFKAFWDKGKASLATIPGRVHDLADLPPGCPFADRCAEVVDACHPCLPAAREVGPGHAVRCVHAADLAERGASQGVSP